MTQPLPPNLPTLNLQYMSPVRPQHQQRAEKILLVWIIINMCITPLGLYAGLASLLGFVLFVMDFSGGSRPFWDELTILEILGVMLFLLDVLLVLVCPPTWLFLCWLCRKRIRVGDLRGATLGARLCVLVMVIGVLNVLGVLYLLHVAFQKNAGEPFWFCVGLLVALLAFLSAVEYTRRVLCGVLLTPNP